MRIFITVRKNGLVFPSSSPGGEVGAWLRWKQDPEGHQPHRHILQMAEPSPEPTGQHRTLLGGQWAHHPQHQLAPGVGEWPSWGAEDAQRAPPLLCGHPTDQKKPFGNRVLPFASQGGGSETAKSREQSALSPSSKTTP